MWRAIGYVAAVYFVAIGAAMLCWPRRLLHAQQASRRRPPAALGEAGWQRPSRRPGVAAKPRTVAAMRGAGVVAVALGLLLAVVLAR